MSSSNKRRNSTLVRLNAELCEIGRELARLRETSMAELFSAILRPVVEYELRKAQAEQKPPGEPSPPRPPSRRKAKP